ncbi:MAG: SsrA-binding protein SmpB [Flavobacteriia bacterium]|nr:SsrA-binding protein SmpB [Flavobacteriia bacterium]NDD50562.1 SsrA-binding protein SmpB [Flavobacteriia bacterium]NDH89786.1 SsrA-binding protein SmpB [Flavobacteriia bacterium]
MNPTIQNRQARFAYHLDDFFTAGLQLYGTEVKSLREGKANLSDSYCYLNERGELYIKNLHIAEFRLGTYSNHLPLRERKLLLKKNELAKIQKALKDVGTTIVPLKLFFSARGWAKLEIATAKGKKLHDKRAALKERDIDRDTKREI